MREEEVKILRMLEEGKITAEQAEKLLEALRKPEEKPETKSRKARWLRIRVYEDGREKPKVNINVPLGLVKALSKLGVKFMDKVPDRVREKLEEQGVDFDLNSITPEQIDELTNSLTSEGPLKLVDVDDTEEGEKVEIMIE
ncbi:hypothetical protein J7K99_00370 [bacterium]|nr:hypothetical protein [bacterium]